VEKSKLTNRTNFFLFILVVVGFVGVFNYIMSKAFVRADLTANKEYTVSKGTKKVLRNLDDLVTVKVFISEKNLPPLAMNLTRTIKDLLAEYEAYSRGNLQIKYFDPTDDPDQKNEARSLGLQEVPMQIIEKDKQQNVMCFMGLAILYGDKKEIVPVLNNVGNLEYDLTSRILKVTRKEVKQVGFFFGNGPHMFMPEGMPPPQNQGPMQSYNNIKKELQEQFEVRDVTDLNKGTPIPADITTLVVAGPKSLSDREKFEIDQFMMKGGKVIALVDAVEIMTQYGLNASKQAHNTGDLFSSYGAKVEQNIVADGRAHASITYQVNYGGFVLPISTPYPLWVQAIKGGFAKDNPAVSTLESMTFMWPSSVDITLAKEDSARIKAVPLIQTTRFAKAMDDNFDLNPRKEWNAFFQGALKSFNLAVSLSGEFKSFYAGKPIPMVRNEKDTVNKNAMMPAPSDAGRVIVEKSPKTNFVLIGDSDFLSDGTPRENTVFMTNLVEWLTLGDNLIGIRSKSVSDRMIDPQLSPATKSALRIVNTIVMPLLVICIGLFVFLRRKNLMKKGADA